MNKQQLRLPLFDSTVEADLESGQQTGTGPAGPHR
ncbi:unnamed protein product, partial [Adineta steineri]